MSRFHADKPSGEEETEDEIDLDANVETVSYAGHRIRTAGPPEDSLVMIPVPGRECDQQVPLVEAAASAGGQSLQTLAIEYGELVKSFPKQEESSVVRAFVNAIESTKVQHVCRKWLDQTHWVWDEVVSFAQQRNTTETMNDKGQETLPERAQPRVSNSRAEQGVDRLPFGTATEATQAKHQAAESRNSVGRPELTTRYPREDFTKVELRNYEKPCCDGHTLVRDRAEDASTLLEGLYDLDSDVSKGHLLRSGSTSRQIPSRHRSCERPHIDEFPLRAVIPREQLIPGEAETDPYTLPSPVSVPTPPTPGGVFATVKGVDTVRDRGKRRQVDYTGHVVRRRVADSPDLLPGTAAVHDHRAKQDVTCNQREQGEDLDRKYSLHFRTIAQHARDPNGKDNARRSMPQRDYSKLKMTIDPQPRQRMGLRFVTSSPPSDTSSADIIREPRQADTLLREHQVLLARSSSRSTAPLPESEACRGKLGFIQRVVMNSTKRRAEAKVSHEPEIPPAPRNGQKRNFEIVKAEPFGSDLYNGLAQSIEECAKRRRQTLKRQ